MSGWFLSTSMTSMWGWPLSFSVTPLLTYFRRASHFTFSAFARVLHVTMAVFSAALSALDTGAAFPGAAMAVVGINAGPPASAATVRHVNRAVAKRDMMQFPRFARFARLFLFQTRWITGHRTSKRKVFASE